MLALILLLAFAYACAAAIDKATQDVGDGHRKRVAKAAKKKGRRSGAKAAALAATTATFAQTFTRGFVRGWRREWPKARARAAARFSKDEAAPETAPAATRSEPQTPAPAASPKLRLVKPATPAPNTTTGDPMALATIPEITGVPTLKTAVARFAAEAGVTAEEAAALAQRASEFLAAVEQAIEQALVLGFGDDGGTIDELTALRDQYASALQAARTWQTAAVDSAAIAFQSSKNIHDRHGHIQEAVAAQGGRMATRQAYTSDL